MSEQNEVKEEVIESTEETTEVSEETAEALESEATEEVSGMKWFIAKTMTGQEGKVQRALKERVVNYKMTDCFAEILVPEETVVTNAGGKKRTIKKKLFPGYILLRMLMNDRTWHLVNDTDKITGFVGGTAEKPAPITDEEAAYMTRQGETGFAKPRANVEFSEGESVKVIEGPFASFVGTIEAVSDKGKVRVNVSIFGRPTPVELDFTQVEKVS